MKTSVGHGADFLLHFRRVHHDDGVPGAAIEKAAVRALAEALLAADAENRIDLYASERRIVLVRNPEHAVFDGTVFDAGGRPGATGAAFGDDGEFLGFFLARRGNAFRPRLVLQLVRDHPRRFHFGWRGHIGRIIPGFCELESSTRGELREAGDAGARIAS